MADKNCSICGGKGYYCEFSTVETCWCVQVPKADDFATLKTELEKPEGLARIAQMLREDAEVFSGCDYEVDHYDKAADGIEWLIAEVERLRKDAERYRWLRELPRRHRHGDMTIMLGKDRPSPNQWRSDTIRGETLDAAIDAALEGGGR